MALRTVNQRRFDWITVLNAILSSAIVVYMLHIERDLADLNAKVQILLSVSGLESPGREGAFRPPLDPRAIPQSGLRRAPEKGAPPV